MSLPQQAMQIGWWRLDQQIQSDDLQIAENLSLRSESLICRQSLSRAQTTGVWGQFTSDSPFLTESDLGAVRYVQIPSPDCL